MADENSPDKDKKIETITTTVVELCTTGITIKAGTEYEVIILPIHGISG
jgi:hypothetical protein